MKKEIEVKFTLEQAKRTAFEKWLTDNAEFKGTEFHEEAYLNNPKKSFFFDHEQGFRDAHTTVRLRHKKITTLSQETSEKELFCTKFCRVDELNRIVSRDEFEIDLSDEGAREKFNQWSRETLSMQPLLLVHMSKETIQSHFEIHGFTDFYSLQKRRTLFRYKNFEIALDKVNGIGSFIEVELKSDEQDVIKGTQQIYNFLREAGIEKITQYDRSYLHMIVNPDYNFGSVLVLPPTPSE